MARVPAPFPPRSKTLETVQVITFLNSIQAFVADLLDLRTISSDSGDVTDLSGTLTLAGGSGITTSATGTTVSFHQNDSTITSTTTTLSTGDYFGVYSSGQKKITFNNLNTNLDHNLLNNYTYNRHIDWTNAIEDFQTSGSLLVGTAADFSSTTYFMLPTQTTPTLVSTGQICFDDSITDQKVLLRYLDASANDYTIPALYSSDVTTTDNHVVRYDSTNSKFTMSYPALQITKNTGAVVGTRPILNFIEGTNVTLTVADNSGNDSVDVTITSSGGGGGGAPTTAKYVTLATDATLTNERVLTAGGGIATVDAGAGSTITVNQTETISGKTLGYTISASDLGKLIKYTGGGGVTLAVTAAATLAAGFFCYVRNDSSGNITIDPDASETVNGSTTYVLGPGGTVRLVCDGSNFFTQEDSLGTLTGNGMVAQTSAGVFTNRTITGPAAGITVSNGTGVSGNPTLALANDLSALEALGSTGIAARTAADTWAQRTITGTSNEVSVANGDGVSGNPTISLPSTLALRSKTVQVQDNNFTISDDGDATKLIAFQASGITTGTTRTLTAQDVSGTIYVSGGTDIPVADGGTGLSSTTAYAVLCGGTTSTNPLQSVASLGTAGWVLTSNGAGALPSFQAVAGGGQSAIQFKDEGVNIGSSGAVTSVDFVGAGVTATESAGAVTVTISGGGAGSFDYGLSYFTSLTRFAS